MMPSVRLLPGDCLDILKTLPESSVHCCVTSPPYWGLRDYGVEGQIGLEKTPEEYVAKLVAVFSEVRRVLREDGTLWLNLGDAYWGGGNYRGLNSENSLSAKQASNRGATGICQELGALGKSTSLGLKPKDLCGLPWRVAFALQADGWYLRSDVIWHKPNPMPESVLDRPTRSHEFLFLMSKSRNYYYDADAIREPAVMNPQHRFTNGRGIKDDGFADHRKCPGATDPEFRNRRDVWTVPAEPFKEAHFATFPTDLIKPCLLAGCPVGGIVLDPFGGSGTTGNVALELGRSALLIELNPQYIALANGRCHVTPGLAL